MKPIKLANLTLLVLNIFLFNCSDESENPTNRKCNLKKEVREYSSLDLNSSWVIEYKYKDDRLVKAGPDTIIYDNKNNIIRVGNFYRYQYDSNGQLIYKWRYGIWIFEYYFTYNQLGKVVKVKIEIDKGPEYSPSYIEYEYSFEYKNETDLNPSGFNGSTFQYDDKKRPLESTNPLIFGENPAVNNILTVSNNVTGSSATEFTYNEWGYPLQAVTIDQGFTTTISYEYDCH